MFVHRGQGRQAEVRGATSPGTVVRAAWIGLVAATALAALQLGTARPAAAQEPERAPRAARERCICMDSIRAPITRALSGAYTLGARARLGIMLSGDTASAQAAAGAVIEDVVEDGAAEEAGLRAGDVITALDGHSLLDPVEGEQRFRGTSRPAARLMALMRRVEPGDTVQVEYLRGAERRTAQVATRKADAWTFSFPRGEFGRVVPSLPRFEAAPFEFEYVAPPHAPDAPHVRIAPRAVMRIGSRSRVLGAELADLNEGLGEYFGAERGALVLRVDEDAPVELRPGDVIQRVDGRAVEDAGHAAQILSTYRRDEAFRLEVLRHGQTVTVEGQRR